MLCFPFFFFLNPSESNLRKGVTSRQKDYNPTEWSQYFAENRDVKTSRGTFRVYLSKQPQQPGPVVVCLHGGGYSALSWAHFSIEITEMVHCTCVAIDLRGHGDTHTDNDDDLSADTMSMDVATVLQTMYNEEMPEIIMIGHSMGGAICVHVAEMQEMLSLAGVVVIDVVEGTAMEALASMQSFLRSRPSHFKSIQHAIEWSIRSGQIRNVQSAKVSMPGQIVNVLTDKLATNELPLEESRQGSLDIPDEKTTFASPMAIPEDEEFVPESEATAQSPFTVPVSEDPKKYKWRIDLSKSEKYWPGWFEGLSNKFLNLRPAKLLLLAGIDNLDKTLTVGQMQGRFQMQVLARCGHAVHEDLPHDVAEVVGSFMLRNQFTTEAGDFVRRMPAC